MIALLFHLEDIDYDMPKYCWTVTNQVLVALGGKAQANQPPKLLVFISETLPPAGVVAPL